VNYTDTEIPFSYAIDPVEYGLAADRFKVSEITAGKVIDLAEEGRPIKRTEALKPNTVRVLEIAPLTDPGDHHRSAPKGS
jgi:hypothetical protein